MQRAEISDYTIPKSKKKNPRKTGGESLLQGRGWQDRKAILQKTISGGRGGFARCAWGVLEWIHTFLNLFVS